MNKKRKWLFKSYVDWKEWGLVVEYLPQWPGWAEIQIGPFVAYWWNPVIDPGVMAVSRSTTSDLAKPTPVAAAEYPKSEDWRRG